MLTSAQMASERLAASPDPQVAKALPRLERALGRAAALSRNVLEYGKSEEPAPQKRRIVLAQALNTAAEDAGLDAEGVRLVRQTPARFAVEADPDQLYRILVNLMRNARQAIESDPGRPAERRGRGTIAVSAFAEDGVSVVRLADDGPGIPPRLAERLFEPFVSSKSSEGTGLGLTISRELAALHGGDLRLVDSDGTGATFELRLPL
jgi:signal transduction histidine kinase